MTHTPVSNTPTRPGPAPTLTERAVDRLAQRTQRRSDRRAERRGFTRRSFLVRTAIVGSALSIAPLRWMLHPTSAYASVCGTGASCGGGWTAFCCTINDGANTCPPGSYVAGWWKIDRSPFCGDAPRYIIDCNRSPDATCSCRCASGTCDERRVCCNNFRYGQCNTQVGGVTEVVCRVVLCTTPWTWDPTCGRTVRTDNRTVTHNAPCLPGTNPTPIELRYQDLGLVGSVLGAPTGDERSGPRSGSWRTYEHGVIAHRDASGTRVLTDDIADAYVRRDGPSGALGYPTSDHEQLGDHLGERVRFERGDIYTHDTGTRTLLGPTAARYRELGGPAGALGLPTSDTDPVGDGRGSVTRFEGGLIYASGTGGARAVTGAIAQRYEQLGGPVGSGLGYPTSSAEPWSDTATVTDPSRQRFQDGLLVLSGGTVHALRGTIARRYDAEGGPSGPWGAPRGDQQRVDGADRAEFVDATVYAGDDTAPHALTDPIHAAYVRTGGPGGELGLPTTDSFRTRAGHDRAAFEGGALEIDPRTRLVRQIEARPTRSPSELTP